MNLTLGSMNFNDAGNWQTWQKATVCVGIVLLVTFLGAAAVYGSGTYQELQEEINKEVGLRVDYKERKEKTITLDSLRRQLEEIEEELEALVKKLPSETEIEALLIDVNQAGVARGLVFGLFKPTIVGPKQEKKVPATPGKPGEESESIYSEVPIDIKLTGDYHGMGGFVSDVAALPRVVTVGDIGITYNKGSLSMDAVAKTYRYLDEKEQEQDQQGAQQ
jgi:type IV pilus assembly protein PilO